MYREPILEEQAPFKFGTDPSPSIVVYFFTVVFNINLLSTVFYLQLGSEPVEFCYCTFLL